MDELIRSQWFGWLLLWMEAFSIWFLGLWRLPLFIEWYLFPTSFFWVELTGAVLGTALFLLIAVMILVSIKKVSKSRRKDISI